MIQATFIASGCFSHSSVEPSMSVKRKVTVPDGNASMQEVYRKQKPVSSRKPTQLNLPARRRIYINDVKLENDPLHC